MPYISREWLAAHVDLDPEVDIRDISAALVKVGLEEERIVPPSVTGPLVAGRVLSKVEEPQKNGKLISYCRVDVGPYNDPVGTGAEPSELPSRGIICGAKNFKVGDTVVVSLPGAVLPGGFQIAARKTYGHVSDGMMCSLSELGLAESSSGIIIVDDLLDDIPAPGEDMIARLGLGEELLEINITPDRGYCFSMRGVAREYSHSTGAKFSDPAFEYQLTEASSDGFPVVISDESPIRGRAGCDRFATLAVRGVDPTAASPDWLQRRLTAAGMRPISLAVDITNYVMLDLGQPMHAYDLNMLSAPIEVRRAREGEHLITLDGTDRELDVEDLLVTDSPEGQGSRVLGIAGVMGGLYGEVAAETTDILLEAAHFDSVSIARSSRRHKLPSEAAKRFERGVDTDLQLSALAMAAQLLSQFGGGQVDSTYTDVNHVAAIKPIDFDWKEVSNLIGDQYDEAEVTGSLEEIGCTVEEHGGRLNVLAPSWRPDLRNGPDLVEEVARLRGLDSIPSVVPSARVGSGLPRDLRFRNLLSESLVASGLTEVLTYPFVGNTHDLQLIPADDQRRSLVKLANPLADDAPFFRSAVLDSLLPVAGRNVSRGIDNGALFEVGRVATESSSRASMPSTQTPDSEELGFIRSSVPHQPWHIAAVFYGSSASYEPGSYSRSWDWADPIETARSLAEIVGCNLIVTNPMTPEQADDKRNFGLVKQGARPVDDEHLAPFHPGRVAELRVRVKGRLVTAGYAGELHPTVCANFGLPDRAVALELNLDDVLDAASSEPLQLSQLSVYPPAKEDIAVVVSEEVAVGEVLAEVRKAGGPLLEEAGLFDVYRSDKLGDGQKSLAFSLRMRAPGETLNAEQISQVRNRILDKLKKRFDAKLRG